MILIDLLVAFVFVNVIGLFFYLSKTIDKSTLQDKDK
jgi:hypothetical protein